MVVLAQRPRNRKKKRWKYVKKRKIKKQSLNAPPNENTKLRNLLWTHFRKNIELKRKPAYHLLDSDTNSRGNGPCIRMKGGCPAQQVKADCKATLKLCTLPGHLEV